MQRTLLKQAILKKMKDIALKSHIKYPRLWEHAEGGAKGMLEAIRDVGPEVSATAAPIKLAVGQTYKLAEKLKAISATKFRKIRLKDVPKSMRKTRHKKSPAK